jgi:hypothetical protein
MERSDEKYKTYYSIPAHQYIVNFIPFSIHYIPSLNNTLN